MGDSSRNSNRRLFVRLRENSWSSAPPHLVVVGLFVYEQSRVSGGCRLRFGFLSAWLFVYSSPHVLPCVNVTCLTWWDLDCRPSLTCYERCFFTPISSGFSRCFCVRRSFMHCNPEYGLYRGFRSVGDDSPASAAPAVGSDKKSPSRVSGGVAKDDKV